MKENSKLTRFLNGKGFYIALGICMVAIGISGWTAMSELGKADETAENSSNESYSSSFVVPEVEVDQIQSDIPDTKNNSSEIITEVEEEVVEEVAAPIAKYFVYPVNGEVLKDFSDTELQYSLSYNDMRLHTGIDIKADAGTAVKSAGDGVVTSVENDSLWGYTVKIDHGNGITGVYCGLTKAITVKKGDSVTAGTNLGPLGTIPCECVDAPHLHLEFFDGEKPISPLSLLKTE